MPHRAHAPAPFRASVTRAAESAPPAGGCGPVQGEAGRRRGRAPSGARGPGRWGGAGAAALAFALSLAASAHAHDGEAPAGEHPEATPDPGAATPPRPPPEGTPPEPREPDLMPPLTLAESVGWIFEPAPAPSDPDEIAARRLERWLVEQLQQDSLEHIGADGWYHHFGRQVRRSVDVDSTDILEERRRGMNVAERLVDELGRYAGGPEAPIDAPGQPSNESLARQSGPVDPAEREGLVRMDMENMLNAPVNWYRVDVRCTHAPDGDLLAVWVVRSSGNRVVDEAALRAIREGSARVAPPPPEIVGERSAIVSEWAVMIGEVATQWNQAGCTNGGPQGTQCAALGRGIIRTRLRLLRVIDERHPTHGEREEAARRRREREREGEAPPRPATPPAPPQP